jgi:hypothetical protein
MIRGSLGAMTLGLWLGALACAAPQESNDEGTSGGAASCEHGSYSECACPDGSVGMQLCAHDTSGFEPCMCGGSDDDPSGPGSTSPTTTTAITTSDDTSSSGAQSSSASSEDDGTGTEAGASSSSDTGPIGAPPSATINHPGDGEERDAGVLIPFIGVADDPEDGALGGDAMVWTDDVDGPIIGMGEQFDAALQTLGDHVVTLTVTDADGNVAQDSIALVIVAP